MIGNIRLWLLCGIAAVPAFANFSVYTSSAAYDAAIAGNQTVVDELYSNGSIFTNGQDILSGSTLDGITYSNFTGFTAADITNQYNSFSPLSLGADNTGGGPTFTYFFGGQGQGITLTFSRPVMDASVFFNVNKNSGVFGFTTDTGETAATGSGAYDTKTFVFAGITSSTPFDSVTLFGAGSYNIPEIQASTPEPSFYALIGIGLMALAFGRRRFRLRETPVLASPLR